ncbi:unnamed protein product, partial [Iphiclides podalirius]
MLPKGRLMVSYKEIGAVVGSATCPQPLLVTRERLIARPRAADTNARENRNPFRVLITTPRLGRALPLAHPLCRRVALRFNWPRVINAAPPPSATRRGTSPRRLI